MERLLAASVLTYRLYNPRSYSQPVVKPSIYAKIKADLAVTRPAVVASVAQLDRAGVL